MPDIDIAGATFLGVPAIIVPKHGGGSAQFTDVSDTTAAAADVASGKYFYDALGVKTLGTASGGSPTLITKSITANGTYDASSDNADGYSSVSVNVSGGTDRLVLLKTESLGYLNITSTSSISLDKSIVVKNVGDYDILFIIVSADTIVTIPSQLAASVSYVWLTSSFYTTGINGTSPSSVIWNMRCQDNGGVRYSSRKAASTAYGIYVYSATFSSDDGSVTMPLYGRKNNNNTGDIDGNYTARVYGVSLRNLIGG